MKTTRAPETNKSGIGYIIVIPDIDETDAMRREGHVTLSLSRD